MPLQNVTTRHSEFFIRTQGFQAITLSTYKTWLWPFAAFFFLGQQNICFWSCLKTNTSCLQVRGIRKNNSESSQCDCKRSARCLEKMASLRQQQSFKPNTRNHDKQNPLPPFTLNQQNIYFSQNWNETVWHNSSPFSNPILPPRSISFPTKQAKEKGLPAHATPIMMLTNPCKGTFQATWELGWAGQSAKLLCGHFTFAIEQIPP